MMRRPASKFVAMRKEDSMLSGHILQGQRHAQATAHAKRGNASFGLAPKHLVQQGDCNSCSGAADWMAERNGAAIDVRFLRIEMQLPVAGQNLCGEGFVDLD